MKDEYITAAEATAKWGLSESTLRAAFNRKSKQFQPGEYKKSGKAWLVKLSAMYRIYGEPKKEGK